MGKHTEAFENKATETHIVNPTDSPATDATEAAQATFASRVRSKSMDVTNDNSLQSRLLRSNSDSNIGMCV